MPDKKTRKIDLINASLKGVNLTDMESKLKIAGVNFDPKYKQVPDKKALGAGEFGVDDTIDVIAVVLTLVKSFIYGGIGNYLAALVALPQAIIGIANVPNELEDLDDEDLDELIAYVIENFPTLPTEKAQQIVEHAVKAVYHIFAVIQEVVSVTEDPEMLDENVQPSKELGTI